VSTSPIAPPLRTQRCRQGYPICITAKSVPQPKAAHRGGRLDLGIQISGSAIKGDAGQPTVTSMLAMERLHERISASKQFACASKGSRTSERREVRPL
jgi:hypothetical protein